MFKTQLDFKTVSINTKASCNLKSIQSHFVGQGAADLLGLNPSGAIVADDVAQGATNNKNPNKRNRDTLEAAQSILGLRRYPFINNIEPNKRNRDTLEAAKSIIGLRRKSFNNNIGGYKTIISNLKKQKKTSKRNKNKLTKKIHKKFKAIKTQHKYKKHNYTRHKK